jgi:peptidase M28-like protein
MHYTTLFFVAMFGMSSLIAQTNMSFTNPAIDEILSGNYDPADYKSLVDYGSPEELVALLSEEINPDSLKSFLLQLSRFENRNTGSDTLSSVRGIGAARNWILTRFDAISTRVGNRLETGFFQFDQDVCGMMRHKNVVALLPGIDPDAELIIVEAHFDSRCQGGCDLNCLAQGMEDNGSGTALVVELARAMSSFAFHNSIMFVATTGEEQGLIGANALAEYVQVNDIGIKLVQNNDVIGGIICGETSSPPSCPGLNQIDSTQVRLFSRGNFNSPSKGLARYIKLQYQEMLDPIVSVPMQLTLMAAEDRTGRGGDHIPFRERGYAAMRFSSANEHGDASNGVGYQDRQHTPGDVLGVDTDTDGELDSFFVDFNYLARNTRINATAVGMAANGPKPPTIVGFYFDGDFFYVEVNSEIDYPQYVIGVRTDFIDFDSLYYLNDTNAGVFKTAEREFSIVLTAASIDSNGVESLFSEEVITFLSATSGPAAKEEKAIRLMGNRPNPFDESTMLSFWVENAVNYRDAYIAITDATGTTIARLETDVIRGLNEVLYEHGYGASGMLTQTLVIDGKLIDSKMMVFAN